MIEGMNLFEDRGDLAPVKRRMHWIVWGLVLQIVGVAIPVVVVVQRAKKDNVVGQVTRYTVRLAWHEVLRSGSDLTLIILGIIIFVAGSIVLARPFVRRTSTLLVAIPLAATLGIMVLGVAVLVGVALVALAESQVGADLGWGGVGWWDGRSKKHANNPRETSPPRSRRPRDRRRREL
jgi:hypothetical protein